MKFLKPTEWGRRVAAVWRACPSEMLVAVCAFLLFCLRKEEAVKVSYYTLALAPLYFLGALLLNRLFRERGRLLYYLLPLLLLPALWLPVSERILLRPGYWVSLLIGALLLLVAEGLRDNRGFIVRVLRYVRDLGVSVLLTGAALVMAVAIFLSVVYIFNVFRNIEEDFLIYSFAFAWMVVFPLIFLAFDSREGEERFRTLNAFDILLNYVLSPALLVYTLILYLYFAKIAFTWSLPKGGIACLVAVFITAAFAVKACQPLLKRRYYDLFYDHFSLFSLPALLMFWVGALYRVSQYGLTEDRVYLLVFGAVFTAAVFLFFFPRWGKYRYVCIVAAVLLSGVTYVYGFTARDIGRRSQTERFERTVRRLDLADARGKLVPVRDHRDTVRKDDYRALYESFLYLRREYGEDYLEKKFGVGSADTLRRHYIPRSLRYYVYGSDRLVAEDPPRVTLRGETGLVDISGFDSLYRIDYGGPYFSALYGDTLEIGKPEGTALEKIDLGAWVRERMESLPPGDTVFTEEALQPYASRWLLYDRDGYRIVFSEMTLERDSVLRVVQASPRYFLFRKNYKPNLKQK